MRPTIASLALVALSFPALSLAQAQERSAPAAARQDRAAVRGLIQDLASPDFEVRKRAAKKLEAYGKKARALLLETVEESEDAEQVWQARRLLRRIEKGRPALKARSKVDPKAGRGKQDKARSKTKARKVPSIDVRVQGFDMRGFPRFEEGMNPEEFAKKIQEFMKRQSRATSRDSSRKSSSSTRHDSESHSSAHSEGTRVMVGPGGIEVDISVTEDGKERRKSYKAKSMEELLKKHPELKGKVGGFSTRHGAVFGPGMLREGAKGGSFFGGGEIEDMERQMEQMERRLKRLLGEGFGGSAKVELHPERMMKEHKLNPPQSSTGKLKTAAPGGPKLGIYLGNGDTASVCRFLGLPEGVGIWVEGRTEDSLADRMGLEKGDFLVKLSGRWIRGAEDVAKALSGAEKGRKIQAQWYRKGKKIQKSASF